MTEWQPMDTAPKDGTIILSHDLNGFFPINKSSTRLYLICWMDWGCDNGSWEDAYGDPNIHIYNPSHWMPIPEAPNE